MNKFFIDFTQFLYTKMSGKHNSSKSPCTDEFFETTETILLKFLLHIPHILSYVLDLNQVKILFFVVAETVKKLFFWLRFRI